ncbi:sensor histidine kinase [Sphingomonas hankookensis]|uniref:sensor histidine kinase n=1 Tax=Sphingomonas hankookensis TaxID=563996 RepID=UPI001F5A5DA2|nr:HAMP domain-containing sensor histidine kinase [Sphingomonas hankookensis]
MIAGLRAVVRRHWPRLRLRTILLATFLFVAALPGVGALFLRVYENSLLRQTEAELVAQSAALAAAGASAWPGGRDARIDRGRYASTLDLRLTRILPERPAPRVLLGQEDAAMRVWAARLAPVLRMTAETTLASIQLLAPDGRILARGPAGRGYGDLPELRAAREGRSLTTLRRNAAYRPDYPFEWLSRASNLRIHHARPIVVDGRVIGVLLLARSPRSLFVGLHEDRGKILFGIVAIFVTLVVLSGLLSRGIVRPVEALRDATRAVAGGGGSVPDPPATAAIEIQALYRDFRVMAEAIAHRSRYLRDFAHAVSHEFKTPLAGIRGAVELLQDHGDMAAGDRERFLSNIAADADRLNLLVSRLLELARADMATREAGVASDLLDVLRCAADARATPAVTLSHDVLPPVAVPRGVLEAALSTLIYNSRQAGAGRVAIAARVEGECVVVTVADDGRGIAPGDRDRVFEPFFTTRRAAGGTGLGLPILRSLLEAHRGGIALDAGEGAVFRLTLPVA